MERAGRLRHSARQPRRAGYVHRHAGDLARPARQGLAGRSPPACRGRWRYPTPDMAGRIVAATAELWTLFGDATSAPVATCGRVERVADALHEGRPVTHAEIWVLDDDSEPCPIGATGEVAIAGRTLATPFGQRANAERQPGDGRLLRTGYRGRWLADGQLQLLDRDDRRVRRHGLDVEPAAIETLLARPVRHRPCRGGAAYRPCRPRRASTPMRLAHRAARRMRTTSAPRWPRRCRPGPCPRTSPCSTRCRCWRPAKPTSTPCRCPRNPVEQRLGRQQRAGKRKRAPACLRVDGTPRHVAHPDQ